MASNNENLQPVFTVEKVVDSAIGKDGHRYYKVKWADSWEPEEHLKGCPLLISQYWQTFRKKNKCVGRKTTGRREKRIENKKVQRKRKYFHVKDFLSTNSDHSSDGETPTISPTHGYKRRGGAKESYDVETEGTSLGHTVNMETFSIKQEHTSDSESTETELFKRTAKLKASYVIKKVLESETTYSDDERRVKRFSNDDSEFSGSEEDRRNRAVNRRNRAVPRVQPSLHRVHSTPFEQNRNIHAETDLASDLVSFTFNEQTLNFPTTGRVDIKVEVDDDHSKDFITSASHESELQTSVTTENTSSIPEKTCVQESVAISSPDVTSSIVSPSNVTPNTALSSNMTPNIVISSNMTQNIALSNNVTPNTALSSNMTPNIVISSNVTPNIASTSNMTPNITSASNVTPDTALSSDMTPNIALSSNVTPNIVISSNVTPNIASASNMTPNITSASNVTPDTALSSDMTPNIALSSNMTPNIALSSNVTPNIALSSNVTPNIASARNLTRNIPLSHNMTPNIASARNWTSNIASARNVTRNVALLSNVTPNIAFPSNVTPNIACASNATPIVALPSNAAPNIALASNVTPNNTFPVNCAALPVAQNGFYGSQSFAGVNRQSAFPDVNIATSHFSAAQDFGNNTPAAGIPPLACLQRIVIQSPNIQPGAIPRSKPPNADSFQILWQIFRDFHLLTKDLSGSPTYLADKQYAILHSVIKEILTKRLPLIPIDDLQQRTFSLLSSFMRFLTSHIMNHHGPALNSALSLSTPARTDYWWFKQLLNKIMLDPAPKFRLLVFVNKWFEAMQRSQRKTTPQSSNHPIFLNRPLHPLNATPPANPIFAPRPDFVVSNIRSLHVPTSTPCTLQASIPTTLRASTPTTLRINDYRKRPSTESNSRLRKKLISSQPPAVGGCSATPIVIDDLDESEATSTTTPQSATIPNLPLDITPHTTSRPLFSTTPLDETRKVDSDCFKIQDVRDGNEVSESRISKPDVNSEQLLRSPCSVKDCLFLPDKGVPCEVRDYIHRNKDAIKHCIAMKSDVISGKLVVLRNGGFEVRPADGTSFKIRRKDIVKFQRGNENELGKNSVPCSAKAPSSPNKLGTNTSPRSSDSKTIVICLDSDADDSDQISSSLGKKPDISSETPDELPETAHNDREQQPDSTTGPETMITSTETNCEQEIVKSIEENFEKLRKIFSKSKPDGQNSTFRDLFKKRVTQEKLDELSKKTSEMESKANDSLPGQPPKSTESQLHDDATKQLKDKNLAGEGSVVGLETDVRTSTVSNEADSNLFPYLDDILDDLFNQ